MAYQGPHPWSSGQSSWFDSRRYQIFWEVVCQERDPLNLVSIIEGLLERKSSGSGLEIWEYGRRDPSRLPHDTLCPQKLALTALTSDCRSVGIVRSRTQATKCSLAYQLKGTVLLLSYDTDCTHSLRFALQNVWPTPLVQVDWSLELVNAFSRAECGRKLLCAVSFL
jgi:hypothetical protein